MNHTVLNMMMNIELPTPPSWFPWPHMWRECMREMERDGERDVIAR